jgi:hypothetical protein
VAKLLSVLKSLCHPERSRRIGACPEYSRRAKRCSCLSVILTVASERSLRATTSDSFAQAKPVPVPYLRNQLDCHPDQKRCRPPTRLFPFPQGKGLGVRLPRTRGDALFLSVILTEASERSLRGRTSDSFAKAKPVPVPSLRIQLDCHPERSEGSRAKRVIAACPWHLPIRERPTHRLRCVK